MGSYQDKLKELENSQDTDLGEYMTVLAPGSEEALLLAWLQGLEGSDYKEEYNSATRTIHSKLDAVSFDTDTQTFTFQLKETVYYDVDNYNSDEDEMRTELYYCHPAYTDKGENNYKWTDKNLNVDSIHLLAPLTIDDVKQLKEEFKPSHTTEQFLESIKTMQEQAMNQRAAEAMNQRAAEAMNQRVAAEALRNNSAPAPKPKREKSTKFKFMQAIGLRGRNKKGESKPVSSDENRRKNKKNK